MAPTWFAPIEGGRGTRPATWQGWLVTVLFLGLVVAAALLGPKGILVAVIAAGAYFGVIYLTKA